MTTNPEVLRLARVYSLGLCKPDFVIEATISMAAESPLITVPTERYDHLRQPEKDNSDAD